MTDRNPDSVTRFYERMYAEGRPGRAPAGVLGQAFARLHRFELHRVPAAFDALEWVGGHLHYFTFSAVRGLLADGGFAVRSIGSTGIFPRVRNLWPTMLGGNIFVDARKLADER
jgi:hypothetical protein